MRKFFLSVVNLFFPVKCFVCKDFLSEGDEFSFCKNCLQETMEDAKTLRCSYCANPLQEGVCFVCSRFKMERNKTAFSFYNRGVGQSLIYGSKFDGRKELVYSISSIVLETHRELFLWAEAYLPIGNAKVASKKRGYCFVTEVVKMIARKTKKPVLNPIAKKEGKSHVFQHFLNAKERRERVKDYFIFQGDKKLSGKKRLLVIDDILTTGSTMEAFVLELRNHLQEVEIERFSFSKTPFRAPEV